MNDWFSNLFGINSNLTNFIKSFNDLNSDQRLLITNNSGSFPQYNFKGSSYYKDGNNLIDNQRNILGTFNVDGTISPKDTSIFGDFKNGWLDFGKFGLGALNTGFGIYSGLKQLGLAEDQLNFTKNAFNTNLANSIKSYNNALEDRARSRYAYMTGNASNADDYINQHKL